MALRGIEFPFKDIPKLQPEQITYFLGNCDLKFPDYSGCNNPCGAELSCNCRI